MSEDFKEKGENMINIEQPAMALNDSRINRTYQMWNTWRVQTTDTRQHIVDWVASVAGSATGGKLKNVVINCHGSPGHMQIGQGIGRNDTNLFTRWRGLVEKIWITGCRVAFIQSSGGYDDGNLFCSAIAKAAHCYVLASTETQYYGGNIYPFGKLDSFEGLLLSYSPEGLINWSTRSYSHWLFRNSE